MVEAIGGGAAVYMQAASKVQASSEVDAARPEIADTKARERGETPPSQRSVEVQISQEAREMAADPRQEKPIQAQYSQNSIGTQPRGKNLRLESVQPGGQPKILNDFL